MEGKLVFPSEDDIQRYINHSGCEKKRAIAMLTTFGEDAFHIPPSNPRVMAPTPSFGERSPTNAAADAQAPSLPGAVFPRASILPLNDVGTQTTVLDYRNYSSWDFSAVKNNPDEPAPETKPPWDQKSLPDSGPTGSSLQDSAPLEEPYQESLADITSSESTGGTAEPQSISPTKSPYDSKTSGSSSPEPQHSETDSPETSESEPLEPKSPAGGSPHKDSNFSAPHEPVAIPPPPGEWDFRLPRVPAPANLLPAGPDDKGVFSLQDLVGATQSGASCTQLQAYTSHYDEGTVSRAIRTQELSGFPTFFFAVETNDASIIRLWASLGGDVNARHREMDTPLLAFAVLNCETILGHTTESVVTLLSLGASPNCFPRAFYSPFHKDLPDGGPDDEDLWDLADEGKAWCAKPRVRERLARTLNLSQRYYLEKSATTKPPTIRHWQVAAWRNAENVLGIQYFLIGQSTAAASLRAKLLSYMTLPSDIPLVLVFAGPSGHGKTELARRLGELLSLPLHIVDCTIYKGEADLFGHRPPYQGAALGTPANNFLARNSGEKCIMFLDEFEKTTPDVHKALLVPFDNGEYQDRRNSSSIDCSKTIWILATNALDEIIMQFCKDNNTAIFHDDDQSALIELLKDLGSQLKEEFKDKFKPPLTGRISSFIPFIPFTAAEQAVVAHKYVLELADRVRRSVNLSRGPNEQLLGNVHLRVQRDAGVCMALAREGYDKDLGARSLRTTVKHVIEEPVVEAYLNVNEEITENQAMIECAVNVGKGRVGLTLVPNAIDDYR